MMQYDFIYSPRTWVTSAGEKDVVQADNRRTFSNLVMTAKLWCIFLHFSIKTFLLYNNIFFMGNAK